MHLQLLDRAQHWAFRGSMQRAAFPIQTFRACLSATCVKDTDRDFPRKELCNSGRLHGELLLLVFPCAKQMSSFMKKQMGLLGVLESNRTDVNVIHCSPFHHKQKRQELSVNTS